MRVTEKDFHRFGRRELLRCSVPGAVFTAQAFAQSRGGRNSSEGKIDVHHHIGFPPSNSGGQPNFGPAWSPEIAIEEMDRNRVATGIGFPGPIPISANVQPGRKLAREYNEYGTRIGQDHPGRFGLFAALPMHDVDGTLQEIDYALTVLKCDGFGIATSYGDMWLGDPKLRPIFEELSRRNAVVYVHPNDAPCCTPATMSYEKSGVNGAWIEWPMNTARTILSVMLAGYTRELPKVRFIFSHAGGVMPLLVSRIQGFTDWNAIGPEKLRQMFPDGIATEFKSFYFEGAQGFDAPNFDALRKLVPDTHILFGTDYNRFPIAHTVKIFESLKLSAATKHAIERGNAETLLPRWKT
jgi:predicted TIM-barrel fold metal-dependent hydrolase